MCGENPSRSALPSSGRGSPPRVRGKPRRTHGAHTTGGITPACAGKTDIAVILECVCGDHPRVCGENFMAGIRKGYPLGSPPRVRGKPIVRGCVARDPGITPACAGKTHLFQGCDDISEDHPRVCGENLRTCRCRNVCVRITPACAGKT